MRLTPQSIQSHCSHDSLRLRGLNIPILEHLDSISDTYTTIDLTSNHLHSISNLPVLLKVRTLLAANNRISLIQKDISVLLPLLEDFSLVRNQLRDMQELVPLRALRNLKGLFLIGNPLTQNEYYREFVAWLLPQIYILDFNKISASERKKGIELFGEFSSPSALAKELLGGGTDLEIQEEDEGDVVQRVLRKLTNEERENLKKELREATSLAEIERIEEALKSGYV